MDLPRSIPMIALALALAACGKNEDDDVRESNAAAVSQAIANSEAAANAAAAGELPGRVAIDARATAQKRVAKTADYSFAYSYPAQAAAIVPLRQWLDADRARLEATVRSDSAASRRSAEQEGFAFNPYDSTTDWRVVTETPRLLSLSANSYSFTGGAHGSPGFRALAWDKQTGQRLTPTQLFSSAEALQAALGERFCRVLDRAREGRRGVPVVRSADTFNGCPKVAQATLILGSTDRKAIDRVGLLLDPYVAGPYAEGTYDLTLRVSPELLQAVKPEYRSAFVAR